VEAPATPWFAAYFSREARVNDLPATRRLSRRRRRHRLDGFLTFEPADIGFAFFGHLKQHFGGALVGECGGQSAALRDPPADAGNDLQLLFRHAGVNTSRLISFLDSARAGNSAFALLRKCHRGTCVSLAQPRSRHCLGGHSVGACRNRLADPFASRLRLGAAHFPWVGRPAGRSHRRAFVALLALWRFCSHVRQQCATNRRSAAMNVAPRRPIQSF